MTWPDGQESYTDEPHPTLGFNYRKSFQTENPPYGSGASSISGAWTLRVRWVGEDPPTHVQFLKVSSNARATWRGGTGHAEADNGLDDRGVTTPFSGGETTDSRGSAIYPLGLNPNVEHTFTVTGSASAAASGGFVENQGYWSLSTQIVSRMVLPWSEPEGTSRRGERGFSVANGLDPVTRKYRVDTTYSLTGLVQRWVYQGHFRGQAVGEWALPLTSVAWSGLPWYWIVLNGEVGFTEAWNHERSAEESHVLGTLFRGPERVDISLDMTDSIGTERAGIVLWLHGPIEDTGERWLTDYTGILSFQPDLVRAGFVNKPLVSFTNQTVHTVPFTVVISSEVTFTYGVNTTFSLTGGIELEALKLNLGSDQTLSSTAQYQAGTQASFPLNVPPGRTAKVDVRPAGTARFLRCSKWGAEGFLRDTHELDVRPGYLDYHAYLLNAPGNSGGVVPD